MNYFPDTLNSYFFSKCFNCTFLFWGKSLSPSSPSDLGGAAERLAASGGKREEWSTAASGCGSAGERGQPSPATGSSCPQPHHLLRILCPGRVTEQLRGLTYPFSARMCLWAAAQMLQWGHIWLPKDTAVGLCESQPPMGSTQLSCCHLPCPSHQAVLLRGHGVSHVH